MPFSEFKPFEARLGHSFRDPSLLKQALTHPSWSHERKKREPNNERLEFLGDAVLQLITSHHLYQLFETQPEGRLTKIRSHLVSRPSLVTIAREMDLGKFLILGTAEEAHGGRERASNLANAMEAVFGAIYLDAGLEAARTCVIHCITPRLKDVEEHPEPDNTKGMLQEKLHARGLQAEYRITSETGPAHQKEFEAIVEVNGEVHGRGKGHTKKEAESRAAQEVLKRLSE